MTHFYGNSLEFRSRLKAYGSQEADIKKLLELYEQQDPVVLENRLDLTFK